MVSSREAAVAWKHTSSTISVYLDSMEEVHPKDKQAFLEEHYPFTPVVKLTDVFVCIHCREVIRVADYKVFRWSNGFLAICCPNAPACDGTVIDWMPSDMFDQ